jgi:hypothetical protein
MADTSEPQTQGPLTDRRPSEPQIQSTLTGRRPSEPQTQSTLTGRRPSESQTQSALTGRRPSVRQISPSPAVGTVRQEVQKVQLQNAPLANMITNNVNRTALHPGGVQ